MPSSAVDEKEQRIQAALGDIRASGLNLRGYPNLSIREAARRYGICHQTLTARYHGRQTRQGSHAEQQQLPPAQEQVLKKWVKSLALRGIPLSPSSLNHYASVITGKPVGERWAYNFRKRHPDLKARWTTTLECCRAKALNRTQVTGFFKVLKDVVDEFQILPSNIYNMDEKGVQLGVGKRVLALVDRDQKNIHQIESGDRELVTVIEAVSADGYFLPPSVIFKGKRRNLEWARDNPCNASVSVSENGWTDMDLGLKWLMNDFEPASARRNPSNGWRLLILDGHNSHCTYSFVTFCERNRIALICLPSHTTHRLQPCDVGVFGPLDSCWKAAVNECSRDGVRIDKFNFLSLYSQARGRAFTTETILSAFRKTGIWPLDPSVIEDEAFTPALNTTTKSAQPISATLPSLIQPVSPATSTPSTQSNQTSAVIEASEGYVLANFPSPLKRTARHADFVKKNQELREWALQAKDQIIQDYALKKLMEHENERIRKQLFTKTNRAQHKGWDAEGGARHMTSEECIVALAKKDFITRMKAVYQEASEKFQEIRKRIKADEKMRKEEIQRTEREQKAAEKAAARVAKKAAAEVAKQEAARIKRQEAEAKRAAVAEARRIKAEQKAQLKAAQKNGRKMTVTKQSGRSRTQKKGDDSLNYEPEVQITPLHPRSHRRHLEQPGISNDSVEGALSTNSPKESMTVRAQGAIDGPLLGPKGATTGACRQSRRLALKTAGKV